MSNKTFVLDTNVLLHDHTCIESFADNTVVLPMAVIEELDKFKRETSELGRNARGVIRRLDSLRELGRLGEGVRMANGGLLKIIVGSRPVGDSGLEDDIPDNKILRVAYWLHKQGEHVYFVSKDINVRIKADALGIEVMDFEKQKVNFDELFSGYREISVKPEVIDGFYANRSVEIPDLELLPNEFVNLISEGTEHQTALGRAGGNGTIVPMNPKIESVFHVKPRSREQRMALELLMDDSVHLVTLVGQAGTGKTLLALAAALEKTLIQKRYDRILVTRPIMPFGKDIGYLPGSKEEKIANWMMPIFDNLAYLMMKTSGPGEHKTSIRDRIDKLLRDEIIELEALTYIRGRSIPKQFVIVDEAQNLTPHEVKTIISRAGEGTKMILTGDPYQIDNPYLDASSNGLAYAVERMKTQSIHGHVTLTKSERSTLAAIAAEIL
ncbi:MAG: PhoH family protein [bacterium]